MKQHGKGGSSCKVLHAKHSKAGTSSEGGHTSISQMVQVVSILEVPKRFGSVSFQSNDVSGAQNSLFLFCMHISDCSSCSCALQLRINSIGRCS